MKGAVEVCAMFAEIRLLFDRMIKKGLKIITPSKDTRPSLIDSVMRMRREEKEHKIILAWAVLNIALAGIIFTQMPEEPCNLYWPVYYIELGLLFLFSLNALFDLWKYFKYCMFPPTITISPEQLWLLGFQTSGMEVLPPQTPEREVSMCLTHGQNVLSYSPGRPPSAIGQVVTYTPSTRPSPYPSNLGPLDGTILQGCDPTSQTTFVHAPQEEDYIYDQNTLKQYLQSEEQKSRSRQLGIIESPAPSPYTPSFWKYTCRSNYNYLRRFQYQPACRPHPPSGFTESKSATEEIIYLVTNDIDNLTTNLRNWINDTILVHLVQEIESINSQLIGMGFPELQIGVASISSLKQIASASNQAMPTLSALVKYLDITSNQEYLVERIKDLAHSFRWNGGGDLRNRKWDTDLPTDSAILMHMLCTYLDSKLPPNPNYPDGKTFTSQFFVQMPDKPDLSNENLFCIYQSSINPPHYKLVHQGHIYSLPKGRNNLFHTILMFLYIIKTRKSGMLGRISLWSSGLNILWVFED